MHGDYAPACQALLAKKMIPAKIKSVTSKFPMLFFILFVFCIVVVCFYFTICLYAKYMPVNPAAITMPIMISL